jgi:hypothetical protein
VNGAPRSGRSSLAASPFPVREPIDRLRHRRRREQAGARGEGHLLFCPIRRRASRAEPARGRPARSAQAIAAGRIVTGAGLEVALRVVLEVAAAIGEGRLEDREPPEIVRCILAAIGVRNRDAASIITQLVGMRRTVLRSASTNAEHPRAATLRKPPAPLKRAKARRP